MGWKKSLPLLSVTIILLQHRYVGPLQPGPALVQNIDFIALLKVNITHISEQQQTSKVKPAILYFTEQCYAGAVQF